MSEIHRDTLIAGQYFAAIAGAAALRRILSRPSEALPRLTDMISVTSALDEFPNNLEIDLIEYDVAEGYRRWSPKYDGPNPAIEAERPVVHQMLADLAPGTALDAACGTGRHAGHLHSLGHQVVAVDATEEMLVVARDSHPDVEFRQGRLERLPVGDETVDVITCALAACHAPDLQPVLDEFSRVLRPGGTVVLSDPHPTTVAMGGVAGFQDHDPDSGSDMTLGYVRNLMHPLHTYVNAATAAGLVVAECREPTFSEAEVTSNPAYPFFPDAVRDAFTGLPFIVVWRFTKPRTAR